MMKKFALLTLFFTLCLSLFAQPYQWPEDWLGSWQGTLTLETPGSDRVREFPMKLEISETDTAGSWNWIITYGEGEKADVRPYLLVAQDSSMSHFLVDERNSILLDQYRIGNYMLSHFRVDSSLLFMRIRHEGDYLMSEISSGTLIDARLSGQGLDESVGVERVYSHRLKALQWARLRREKE
jgi:hypothetical protein